MTINIRRIYLKIKITNKDIGKRNLKSMPFIPHIIPRHFRNFYIQKQFKL